MGDALEWMDGMAEWLGKNHGVDVMAAVPAPFLAVCADKAPEGLHILAQNVSADGFGAHTGEYTADMLKSCGVDGAIVGHSERRARFGDTDAAVAAKVDALLEAGLTVVFCCGETLQEREGGRAEDVVLQQLQAGSSGLDVDDKCFLSKDLERLWSKNCIKILASGYYLGTSGKICLG